MSIQNKLFNCMELKKIIKESIHQYLNENYDTNVNQGINIVFQQHPELINIGTPEQYSKYIETIFPNSKFKNIVYHGTDNPDLNEFYTSNRGIHFGTLQAAKDRRIHTDYEFKNYTKIIPVILNITNPLKTEQDFNFEQAELEFDDSDSFDFTKEQGYRLLITYLYNKGFDVYNEKGEINSDDEILKNAGFDGIIYKNEIEDKGNYSYAVYNPEQIHILGSKQDVNQFKSFLFKKNNF